jgi:hypothetical protein
MKQMSCLKGRPKEHRETPIRRSINKAHHRKSDAELSWYR